jgi:hypothetical protein
MRKCVVPSRYWPEEHCAETLARRRVLKRRRRVIEFLDSARIVVIFGLFLEKMIRRASLEEKKDLSIRFNCVGTRIHERNNV